MEADKVFLGEVAVVCSLVTAASLGGIELTLWALVVYQVFVFALLNKGGILRFREFREGLFLLSHPALIVASPTLILWGIVGGK